MFYIQKLQTVTNPWRCRNSSGAFSLSARVNCALTKREAANTVYKNYFLECILFKDSFKEQAETEQKGRTNTSKLPSAIRQKPFSIQYSWLPNLCIGLAELAADSASNLFIRTSVEGASTPANAPEAEPEPPLPSCSLSTDTEKGQRMISIYVLKNLTFSWLIQNHLRHLILLQQKLRFYPKLSMYPHN